MYQEVLNGKMKLVCFQIDARKITGHLWNEHLKYRCTALCYFY